MDLVEVTQELRRRGRDLPKRDDKVTDQDYRETLVKVRFKPKAFYSFDLLFFCYENAVQTLNNIIFLSYNPYYSANAARL